MGIKFYRGSDKSHKFRKRFQQTRSWFRTLKWVAYHAHPTFVAGHPFKGGYRFSTGFLQHPDLKRFKIGDVTFYVPPRPDVHATAAGVGAAAATAGAIPSFGDFFATYFGGRNYTVSEPACSKMMEGMKRCWENHSESNPVEACQYYIGGFSRLACGK